MSNDSISTAADLSTAWTVAGERAQFWAGRTVDGDTSFITHTPPNVDQFPRLTFTEYSCTTAAEAAAKDERIASLEKELAKARVSSSVKLSVELSDDQIYDCWLSRDCMDALRAGDMKAQFVHAARAVLAKASASVRVPPLTEADKHPGSLRREAARLIKAVSYASYTAGRAGLDASVEDAIKAEDELLVFVLAKAAPAPVAANSLMELRARIKEMQEAAYTHGDYSKEAVRVALDGVLDEIDALAAAPAAAPVAAVPGDPWAWVKDGPYPQLHKGASNPWRAEAGAFPVYRAAAPSAPAVAAAVEGKEEPWQENNGVQPVGNGVRVQVELVQGARDEDRASAYYWTLTGSDTDIARWRPAAPAPTVEGE